MAIRVVSNSGIRLLIEEAAKTTNNNSDPGVVIYTLKEYRDVEKALIDNRVYWNGGNERYPNSDDVVEGSLPRVIFIGKRTGFDKDGIIEDSCRLDIALFYGASTFSFQGGCDDRTNQVLRGSLVRTVNNFEEE